MAEKKTFQTLKIDPLQRQLLEQVAELHEVPEGAFSLRVNGQSAMVASSEHITIVPKTDKPGIDIYIAPGTKHESMHIPVVLSQTGLKDLVYNDFHIGEDADVVIVAGCGIHNCGEQSSAHDGVHTFYVGKNARVKYVERHYGVADDKGDVEMNPTTIVHLDEGAYLEMDTTQIKGVDHTVRETTGDLAANATFIVKEKLMTDRKQYAETRFSVDPQRRRFERGRRLPLRGPRRVGAEVPRRHQWQHPPATGTAPATRSLWITPRCAPSRN